MEKKRKGFTFVELLIVIIIIAALSAVIMMYFSDSVYTTKANTIVSNMSIVKNAVMFYAASDIRPTLERFKANVETYLGDKAIREGNNYSTGTDPVIYPVMYQDNVSYDVTSDDQGFWYVRAEFTNDPDAEGIKEKLVGVSSDIGLLNDNRAPYSGTGDIVKIRIQ